MMNGKVSRRQFLQGLAVAAGGAALAACAAPVAPSAPEGEEDAGAMAEGVTISYMTRNTYNFESVANAVVPAFEEKTGHKVEVQLVNDTIEALPPTLAAGTAPDTVVSFPRAIVPLYAQETFLPLNSFMEEAGLTTDDFFEGDLLASYLMDRQFGMPIWHGIVFYIGLYRRDLFEDAGVPGPPAMDSFESWADLYETAAKVMERDASGNVTRWGFDASTQWSGSRILGAIKEQGSHWWDEGSQTFNLTSDETVNAIKNHLFDPIFEYGISYDEAHDPGLAWHERLTQGVVAMQPWLETVNVIKSDEMWDLAEVIEPYVNPTMAPGVTPVNIKVGGWHVHMVRTVAEEKRVPAGELCMIQVVDLDVAAEIQKTVGAGSALRSYRDHPVLDEIAQTDRVTELRAFQYKIEADFGVDFGGWEWGDLGMAFYPDARCRGEEGEARCAQTGSIASGKVTPEQIAEEWQEEATTARKEFYESIGIEV